MSGSESMRVLPEGTAIGPYVVTRPLGAGAFGAVYEARKKPLDKRIALKLLHPDKARDGEVNARFVQEAQAAAGVKHPHIVEVDDVGVIDGIPYIAMEFLEGESLADLLAREGPLTPERALDVLIPALSAVAAVHARGIVHRDLKPDNLFLWKPVAGQVHPKLLDFGIAKVREGEGAALTKTGMIMGTPMYMSPEQWGGSKNATAASDQWSLGVILYQCLSGRLPFEAEELPALMMRISMHPPAPLQGAASGALGQVVLRALEKDPSRRYASVREFGRALLPFARPSTRDRWSAEFDVGSAPAGFTATLDVSVGPNSTLMSMAPPTPHSLNASVQTIGREAAAPATPKRAALIAVGALALIGFGFGASRFLGSQPPRTVSVPALVVRDTPPVAPAVVPAPPAPVAPAPVLPAATAVVPTLPVVPEATDAGVQPTRRPRHRRTRGREGGLMI